MKAPATRQQSAQRVRWERMHVAIRCGLHPTEPALIRVHLSVGRWLVRQGQLDELAANQRLLALLFDTARDGALPWFWRSVCLEHTAIALARMTTLLKRQDPQALQTLFDGLQSAQAQLATEVPSRLLRQTES